MTSAAYSVQQTRISFPGPFQLQLEARPLAGTLQPHELLLKCIYSLISAGTELAMFTQTHIGFGDPDNTYAKYPFHPGYAAVGRVEAVGAEVSRFQPGDFVYYPGRHQSYHVDSSDNGLLLAVPKDMSLLRVPFAAMTQIAFTSVYMSQATAGDSVAVLGLGLVGNLASQLFMLRASPVIAVDLVEFRRQLARQAGVRQTVDAEKQDIVHAVRELTGGIGPRTVVEATGVPALVAPALKMVRDRGEVILLGSPRGTAVIDVYDDIHRKGVHLIGAHTRLVPAEPLVPSSLDRAGATNQLLHLLDQGRVVVDHLVTDVVTPDHAEAAYNSLHSGKDKSVAILIDWSGS